VPLPAGERQSCVAVLGVLPHLGAALEQQRDARGMPVPAGDDQSCLAVLVCLAHLGTARTEELPRGGAREVGGEEVHARLVEREAAGGLSCGLWRVQQLKVARAWQELLGERVLSVTSEHTLDRLPERFELLGRNVRGDLAQVIKPP